MGIKVENNMLVLDSTFTKEDVQAIDEFVRINVNRERERIIKLLTVEMERIFQMRDYPATNALANIRATLIKNSGE